MSTEYSYQVTFKEKMVEFLDELIDLFPQEASFYLIRVFVKDKIPLDAVIGRFMSDCLKYYDYVEQRNDKLFLNTSFMYRSYGDEFGNDQIDRFKDIWLRELDKYNKEQIWQWMTLFFKLSMNYYKKFGPVEDWPFDLEEQKQELKNI